MVSTRGGSFLATREVFWNISYSFVMYLLAIIAVGYWAYTLYRRYQLWHIGKPEDRTKDIGRRIGAFIQTLFTEVLTHRKFLRDPYSGIMHLLIFWGWMILLLASAVDAMSYYTNQHIVGKPYLWFSLIVDIGGLLVLFGMLMAACRRYLVKPTRLNTVLDDGILTVLIVVILITGYMVEGLRQAATELKVHPEWAIWSPGGFVFAKAFEGVSENSLLFWHRFLWWFHAILTIGGFVYVGRVFSKLQHVVVSPLNIFFRNLGPVGVPAPIDIEKAETLGAGEIKDFTWKQLLDLDACTNCGRCQDACPAWATGKPLSPRKLVQDLKGHMQKAAKKELSSADPLIGEGPSEAEIWACTTCAACQETCPVYVEHLLKIIELRRNLVLAQSKMPESAQLMLRNMQSRGHPWAGIQSLRLRGDWTSEVEVHLLAEGDQVETLFWVGCTGALVERNVQTTLAITKILKAAGIPFGVLGEAETCCGDPARRTGYEFQFQIMAEQNIETFKNHQVKQIITSCPHCYHTLKHEYPQYGGDFTVVHYTQFLADLIKQGKLRLPHALNRTVTYQDPCYLSRYHHLYLEPRQILTTLPQLRLNEMSPSRDRGFCCGGGGGHMWIEEQPGTTKINQRRLEDVLKTGAETVVTACPYCLQMFEESIEHKGMKDSLKARDLAELVEEAMKRPSSDEEG